MKKLAWLSVEDYGTTPMEIVVASVMNGYLRRLPEQEALKKVENIIEPKVIQLFGEGCLLYTSPSPRDPKTSRMPSSA